MEGLVLSVFSSKASPFPFVNPILIWVLPSVWSFVFKTEGMNYNLLPSSPFVEEIMMCCFFLAAFNNSVKWHAPYVLIVVNQKICAWNEFHLEPGHNISNQFRSIKDNQWVIDFNYIPKVQLSLLIKLICGNIFSCAYATAILNFMY